MRSSELSETLDGSEGTRKQLAMSQARETRTKGPVFPGESQTRKEN